MSYYHYAYILYNFIIIVSYKSSKYANPVNREYYIFPSIT